MMITRARQSGHILLYAACSIYRYGSALGIGATTLLFSVTYSVLMKPLPWPNADRLVVLKETRGGRSPRFGSFTNAAYIAWREQMTNIEDIAAWSRRDVTLAQAGDPERIRGRFAADTGMTTTAIFGGSGPIEISAQPLRDALTADVRRPLIVLLVAVGLMFATATANVASLNLARATTRRREIAVRAALGAGSLRLARQLVVENLLIGFAGGGAGLAAAWWFHRLMPSLLPIDFPRLADLRVNATVILFALLASVIASMICGLLPALYVRRLHLVESLAEEICP